MDKEQRVINQTRFENLALNGFPEGCLSNAYVDGVIITRLPQNIKVENTRFYECRFRDLFLDKLDLEGCVIADGIFLNIMAQELNLSGATVYGTLFSCLDIEKLDMSGITIRHSSMREGKVDRMYVGDSTIESTYFYRLKPERIDGIERARLTMGGATNQEVENYQRQVREALMEGQVKKNKIIR